MVTNNFKAICAAVLQATGGNEFEGKGYVGAIKTLSGGSECLAPLGTTNYPYEVYAYYNPSNFGGFILSTDSTPATAGDYEVQGTIDNLECEAYCYASGVDESGNPYITYRIDIENWGESTYLRSIGYAQTVTAGEESSDSTHDSLVLLDRTVLPSVIYLPQNELVTVDYTLKTILY